MTKKYIAQDFLKLAAKGHSHEAFRLYIGENFKHHNAYFKGDAQTLMLAMEESSRKNPNKTFEIHHALRDGDLVAVHSHVKQNSNDLGAAVVHIFRFEADKIVELWDLGQPIPAEKINENGMF
ncbi:nuclear transport factor 2 family protein [Flavobacterium sp. JLP]|uniref:nuclear transport factor 2 family protein n=1 Tax=unclassified Flavobacterium TaxID=196869 RepID=UPI000493035A|nr:MULTISPECIES: nuclear transport factor 2 family protein [unclassified Flavobacterium]MBF4493265.1 nuclear transport factor 2 family protein [Flavobacterium sp. MR2016-29]MBF4507529.1 nuclear transport factor 2 family protein [Flavobacterium sp. JLP]